MEQVKVKSCIANQLELTGKIFNTPVYNENISGVRIARFKLWHQSLQQQLDGEQKNSSQKVEFTIDTVIINSELISKLQAFNFYDHVTGLKLRPVDVKVSGYLSARRNKKTEDIKFILHANKLDFII